MAVPGQKNNNYQVPLRPNKVSAVPMNTTIVYITRISILGGGGGGGDLGGSLFLGGGSSSVWGGGGGAAPMP